MNMPAKTVSLIASVCDGVLPFVLHRRDWARCNAVDRTGRHHRMVCRDADVDGPPASRGCSRSRNIGVDGSAINFPT